MPLPNQAGRNLMFNHELNAVKGWFGSDALDKSAAAVIDVTDPIQAGMVCSLDSEGMIQKGLAENAMPIFVRQNSYDHDVVGPDGNLIGSPRHGSMNLATGEYVPDPLRAAGERAAVAGVMSGLVATGGFEVESTEFDTDETYNVNDPLTAGAPGDADAGTLKPGVHCVDTICGIVSDPVPAGGITNEHQRQILRFWTVFLPVCAEGTGTGE